MPTYVEIQETQTDVDAPITADLMKGLNNNPLAIAEGSTGAPKVSGLALSHFVGSYSLVDVTGNPTITTVSGLGDAGKIQASAFAVPTLSAGGHISYLRSNDGGATFIDETSIIDTDTKSRTMVIDVSGGIDFVEFRANADSGSRLSATVDVFIIARDGA